MSETLNILIVDDSATYRMILKRVVEQYPQGKVVGLIIDGTQALDAVREKRPDVILLDLMMPGIDGLEVLRRLREDRLPGEVIMVSGVNENHAQLTIKALQRGALDFVLKPTAFTSDESFKQLSEMLYPLLDVVRNRKKGAIRTVSSKMTDREPSTVLETAPPLKREIAPPVAIEAVAIGVSTGGPVALRQIIPRLRSDFGVPIFLVQHMPPLFTATLATQLDQISSLRVREGRANEIVSPGNVYIAPGGFHMIVRGTPANTRLVLEDSSPVNNCKPAVDRLFESIAKVYGGKVLAVILTGMGSDGTAGVRALRSAGAYAIAQDNESSVVWGMPGSLVKAGQADEVLPLNDIASRIVSIVKAGRA
ncbi:MAG: chemotaxis response regulator protein-glutamate methylesterase [bacterium]